MQGNKKIPTFNVGDKIKFEVGKGTNHARWNYNEYFDIGKDFGESNVWASGIIVDGIYWYENKYGNDWDKQNLEKDNRNWYFVKFTIPDMLGEACTFFPKPGCPLYIAEQWDRPGFFQLDKIITCECGCDKIYGPSNRLHSAWCPKKEKRE